MEVTLLKRPKNVWLLSIQSPVLAGSAAKCGLQSLFGVVRQRAFHKVLHADSADSL